MSAGALGDFNTNGASIKLSSNYIVGLAETQTNKRIYDSTYPLSSLMASSASLASSKLMKPKPLQEFRHANVFEKDIQNLSE